MTLNASPGTNRLAKIRRYRRLMYACLLVGVGVGLALRVLDFPLVGEAVYWLGIVGFLAVWWGTPVRLFDERDAALERRASQLTLYAFAVVLVVGASLARVLPHVGAYTVPPEARGALYGYVALFAGFGVVYLWLRYRP